MYTVYLKIIITELILDLSLKMYFYFIYQVYEGL